MRDIHEANPLDELAIMQESLVKISDGEHGTVLCELVEYIDDKNDVYHNCLGCNLDVTLSNLMNVVDVYSATGFPEANARIEIHAMWTSLILNLHMVEQEMEEALRYSGLSYEAIRSNFEVIPRVKVLANFLKHPKTRLFLHHPLFIFSSSELTEEGAYAKNISILKKQYDRNSIVTESELKRYYTNSNKDTEFISKYANQGNVVILLPSVADVFYELTSSIVKLVSIYKTNPMLVNNLRELSLQLEGNLDEMIEAYELSFDDQYDIRNNR